MRQARDFDLLTDKALDVLFGQHVGGYICDSASAVSLPQTCSLYGKCSHYAPDDWNMPHPIGAGGEDFDAALEASRKRFDGIQIDIVLLTASEHEVFVTRATQPGDTETRADPTRENRGKWIHGHERDRWISVRRSVIKCILALADAPPMPTIKQPTAVTP